MTEAAFAGMLLFLIAGCVVALASVFITLWRGDGPPDDHYDL